MAATHRSPLDSSMRVSSPILAGRDGEKPEDRPLASEPASEVTREDNLRAEGHGAARSWRPLRPADTRKRFAQRLAEVSRQIGCVAGRLLDAVSSGVTVKGDGAVLLAHLMSIRTALRECRQALRSKCPLPQVECDVGHASAPRVYAISMAFLNSTGEQFDEARFPVFAEAIQEEAPLEMKELWNLRTYLEFALLERIAEATKDLRMQSSAPLAVVNTKQSLRIRRCAESLRQVLELDWKKLFEKINETEKALQTDPLGAYSRMDFESRDAYRAAVADMAFHSRCSEHEVAQEAIALARQAQRSGGLRGRAKERRSHVGFYLAGPGQRTLKQHIGYRAPARDKLCNLATRSPDYFYFLSIELIALALLGGGMRLLDIRPSALWVAALLFFVAIEGAVGITNALVTSLLPPKKLPKLDFSKGIPNHCATMVAVPTLLASEAQVKKAVKDLEIRYLGNRDRNLHFALLTDPPDSQEPCDERDALAGFCSQLVDQLNRAYGGKNGGSFFHFHRPRTYNSREGVWMGWERKRGKLLQFNRFLLGQEDAFSIKTGDLSIVPGIRYLITLDADTQLPHGAAHRMIGAMAHPLNAAGISPSSNTVREGYGILQPRVEISARSAHRSRLASLFSGETGLDIYTRAVSDVYQDLFGEGIFSGKGIYEVRTFHRVLDQRLPSDSILSHDLIEGAYARAGLLSDVEVIDDYPSNFSALSRRKHRWMRGDWQISPWLLSRVRDSAGHEVGNPISHVSWWKIFDNLRRSLSDVAIFGALLYAWFAIPEHSARWALVLLGVLLLPVYLRFLLGALKAGRNVFLGEFWRSSFQDLASAHARALIRLAFLCHQALIEADAAIRTLVRLKITRHHLLEWETAAEAESAGRDTHAVDQYARASSILAIAAGALLMVLHPEALLAAMPFVGLWAALPRLSAWLDTASEARNPALSGNERALLRGSALRTWRFFREFSTAEENWLVPDLLQETPPLVAHRISTTNLGLLLNARLAAYDLGYLTAGELAEATERTLQTVERMPKYKGQLYNWYSTHTLQPDQPLFVSTVDNGNLLCSLWTLQEGCREIASDPLFRPVFWQGIQDHVDLLAEIAESDPPSAGLGSAIADMKQRLQGIAAGQPESFGTFATLKLDTALLAEKLAERGGGQEIRWWAGELESRVKHHMTAIRDFAPWLRPEYAPVRKRLGAASLPRVWELSLQKCPVAYAAWENAGRRVANSPEATPQARAAARRLGNDLRRSASLAKQLREKLSAVANAAQRLADGMDFGLFFDEKREMLAIGYDAGEESASKWHYDLLPSEARSAVFGGIAQGTIPQKTWFRLGRFHGMHNGEPLLYSWAGTMFEYLMPCLWTKAHRNSLLERSARAAIRVQRTFAEGKGDIPWGVSECACNEYTPDGHYVYHAFGVPTLALHRDEYSNDVVIAPYATFLAMLLEPVGAAQNVAKMKKLGWLGAYGFYDAADFTARRNGSGKDHEIVRTWMAHHQGMTLVALSNALCDSAMQRRFHADSRVAAAERILHEKPPRAVPAWEKEIVEAFRPSGALADAAKSGG